MDALLGIDVEEVAKEAKKPEESGAAGTSSDGDNSIAPVEFSSQVVEALAKAEAERMLPGASEADRKAKEKDIAERMNKIVENARKMSDTKMEQEGKAGLDREMNKLSLVLMPDSGISKEDQKKMKEKVFGPNSFYVTSIQSLNNLRAVSMIVNLNSPSASSPELLQGSILVRGNLRAERSEVFDLVCKNLQKEFGDTYTAIMVTDPEEQEEDPRGGPRVAFQITSTAMIQPQKTATWQYGLAALLGVFTLATCFQLGLVANVSALPQEVIDFVQQPEALKGVVPIEVEDYDPIPYFLSALPIALAVLGQQTVHEVAHRVVASTKKIKLGAPILLPNAQVGCFGAITQLKSLVRNRTDLFDVAAAGPAAGAAVSAALFVAGLALSQGNSEGLLPVPAGLLQGSLALGSVAHLVLGDALNTTSTISVHPLLIAGWCGLVSSALNCLPVGCLDGGRITMAAFGRNLLSLTSFFTYVGLGLGFLGSSLALPFGVFVLICQRNPEKNLQDTVSPPSNSRQVAAAVMISTAILILLPMLPGSETLGAGGGLNL